MNFRFEFEKVRQIILVSGVTRPQSSVFTHLYAARSSVRGGRRERRVTWEGKKREGFPSLLATQRCAVSRGV